MSNLTKGEDEKTKTCIALSNTYVVISEDVSNCKVISFMEIFWKTSSKCLFLYFQSCGQCECKQDELSGQMKIIHEFHFSSKRSNGATKLFGNGSQKNILIIIAIIKNVFQ